MDINADTQLQKQICSVVFSDITEDTKLQCVKCLKAEDEIADCDLCNWHTETAINEKANAN